MADAVEIFLTRVYASPADPVALCFISPHGSLEHRWTTVGRVSRYVSYARYRNAHGWNIFVTPSVLQPLVRHRRKAAFQPLQKIIYLDCDQPDCLREIRRRYPAPTLVVRTSRDRHQVYWRLRDEVSVAEQESLMSRLARDLGADRAATDVSRVLRLPSFWNRKPGRGNTVDIVFQRDDTVTVTDLSRWLPPSVGHPLPPSPCENTPRGGAGVLASTGTMASPSERDWHEVHRRLAQGIIPCEVVDWLQHHRSDKRNPRYYAELTVSKALRMRDSIQMAR